MTDENPMDLDELMKKIGSSHQNTTTSDTPDSNNSNKEEAVQTLSTPSDTHQVTIDTSKIRLVIATPCYGGGVQAHYLLSLIQTIELLRDRGIKYEVSLLPGDSLVPRARNALVAKFLSNPDNTHLMFIDADIHWNPMEILKLLGHDKPLVGGLYPLKSWRWENLDKLEQIKQKVYASHNQGLSESEIIQHNLLKYDLNFVPGKELQVNNNLLELRHLATGFMMIQRDTFTRMISCIGEDLKYTDDCGALTDKENPFLYAFFDCAVKRDHYLSEDWLFCDRWRQLGGEVFADITVALTHLGYQTFPGRFLSTIDLNSS